MTLERLPEQRVLPPLQLLGEPAGSNNTEAAPLGIINSEAASARERFLALFKRGTGSAAACEAEVVPESQGAELLVLPRRSDSPDNRPLLTLPPLNDRRNSGQLLALPARPRPSSGELLPLEPRKDHKKPELKPLSKAPAITPDSAKAEEPEPIPQPVKKPSIKPAVVEATAVAGQLSPANLVVSPTTHYGTSPTVVRVTPTKRPARPTANVVKTSVTNTPASVTAPATDEKVIRKSAERKWRLKRALLLGAIAVHVATSYGSQKLREMQRSRLSKATPKVAGSGTSVVITSLKAPRTSLRDKPLEMLTRVRLRTADFSEKGREHKGLIIAALGTVATIGVAYLAYKGIHHGDSSVVAQNAVPAPGSSGGDHHSAYQLVPKGHHLAPDTNTLSVQPPSSGHAADQLAPKTHMPHTLNHGDTVMVHNGDGLTNVIDTFAKQHHQNLSGAESYGFYQQLHAHFGNNILSSGTFNMPGGNIGISRPGLTTWNPDAQAFLEDLLKAAKKKKELS